MSLQFTSEETFAVEPERVLRGILDLDSFSEWMPNFVGVEKLTSGDPGVGTQFRETRKMYGRTATEHFEITDYEPGKTLELTVDGAKGTSGKAIYRFRYTCQPDGDTTRLELEGQIDGMGVLGRLIGRLMIGRFKKAIDKDHAALKMHLETAASP